MCFLSHIAAKGNDWSARANAFVGGFGARSTSTRKIRRMREGKPHGVFFWGFRVATDASRETPRASSHGAPRDEVKEDERLTSACL